MEDIPLTRAFEWETTFNLQALCSRLTYMIVSLLALHQAGCRRQYLWPATMDAFFILNRSIVLSTHNVDKCINEFGVPLPGISFIFENCDGLFRGSALPVNSVTDDSVP